MILEIISLVSISFFAQGCSESSVDSDPLCDIFERDIEEFQDVIMDEVLGQIAREVVEDEAGLPSSTPEQSCSEAERKEICIISKCEQKGYGGNRVKVLKMGEGIELARRCTEDFSIGTSKGHYLKLIRNYIRCRKSCAFDELQCYDGGGSFGTSTKRNQL
jgi:hypothetical protein